MKITNKMENSSQKHFNFNFREILIDQIALDGLGGIGIDLLWRRVERIIKAPVTEKMRIRFWGFIVNCDAITFYRVPEPTKRVELTDRFQIIDQDSGNLLDPPDYLDGDYEYHPISNEYGSCTQYDTRELISKEKLRDSSYEDIVQEYGNTLVMVASIEERWRALAPHMPITCLKQLTPIHFCILELVGKSRDNGQMTIGMTNLTKIIKDPKLLFYNRQHLQQLDLIRAQGVIQTCGGRGCQSLLLRLKRFHQPLLLSLPKTGKLHNIVSHLMGKPDFSDTVENMIIQGILPSSKCKKLRKCSNLFSFGKKTTPILEEAKGKKNKRNYVKKTFIKLTPVSEESSHSDGEAAEEPRKCEYKVHSNLMRQAYERFLEAGLKGLTQVEIAQLLGVEFYTARTICRTFKTRNIVREFFEDKGKQRIAKYIATISGIAQIDMKYEEEKKKFLEYLDENVNAGKSKPEVSNTVESMEPDNGIPSKKRKLDTDVHDNVMIDTNNTIENRVTEIPFLEGLENFENYSFLASKKNLTLRQLKYANGIVKVLRDKVVISGYQTLNSLVAKEINEAPMATRSMKTFVQKLLSEGQLKILKMSWPGFHQKHSIFICAPHVQRTHPIIKAKFKEVNVKAIRSIQVKAMKPTTDIGNKSLSFYLYPRYLKIQKLHEFIMKLVYFNDDDTYNSNLPPGFSSIVDIMPELTVEFMLGNLSNMSIVEVSKAKIPNSMLQKKLKNVPTYIFKMFLVIPSLQNSLRLNLKILAMFGLIQLIKKPRRNDLNNIIGYEFYVNRHAKIINTEGVWPRENVDKEALEKSYYFETFQDVEAFWNDVYNISIKTKIKLDSNARCRKHPLQDPRLREEVESHDNGQVLGNGLGPCGFDSSFFMEVPRFWSVSYAQLVKKHQILQKKPLLKIPRRGKPKVPGNKRANAPKKIPAARPIIERKPINKPLKRKRESTIPKWSKEEDRIIMLCKAAMTVMSPVAQTGCLKIRNLVAKDIVSIYDPLKTGSLCHKRAVTLESNTTLQYEKDCIINELKRHMHVIQKYEGLLKTLRLQYSGNMKQLTAAARIPMMELVWIMIHLVQSESFNRKVPCVAMNYEDFHKNFTICPSSVNRNYNSYKTSLNSDPVVATIKEGIILAVMTTFKTSQSSEIARIIYSMFVPYPEQTLRPAIEQLRKCGAVSTKDKIMNSHVQQINFQDIVQSSYKISASYQRKWISRLNSEFVHNMMLSLDDDLPESILKGSAELNCLLLELKSCDVVDLLFVSAPVITGSTGSLLQEDRLTTVEVFMKYKLKSGTMEWRNKTNIQKFSELFKDLEFDKTLKSLTENSKLIINTEYDDTENEIILHLKEKKESGCTFQELQNLTGYDSNALKDKLSALELSNVIKRLGYYENVIVLTEFAKPWTLNVENELIVPTPWLTLDMDIRNDVLLKWSGEVMNKIFKNPGCSIAFLSDACEFLTTRAVQDICILLEKCKCVMLKCIKNIQIDLFSEDDTIPDIEDFNQYDSVDNILVFPEKDALTKYAYLRKKMFHEYSET